MTSNPREHARGGRRPLTGWFLAATLSIAGGVSVAGDRGWSYATPGRPVTVPADHVSHPEYKIEWWYYTGNLDTRDGRRFGYQLTFFRVGIDPAPTNPSRWTVRDLHMAHFAVTDVTNGRFRFFERLQREGAGWAGASTRRLHVWNGRWSAEDRPDGSQRIRALQDGFALDLELGRNAPFSERGDRRWVAQGENGYSRKGGRSGNASYYYSMTRLDSRGTVTFEGTTHEVTGQSWMDHEFGTSMLEPDQVGWDWFALQLADGRDIMLYQMRRKNGSRDPHSVGTIVTPGRAVRRLRSGDYALEPLEYWTSPATGIRYPLRWRVDIPAERLTLEVRAAVRAQELHTPASTAVTYWEGAVDVSGTAGDRRLMGRGYMELTGYSGVPLSESFRER
ncbi:MAG TPA: lipocalin-like domain-containing protein [Vicinamibacterales bacterium]